jgi:hypothetical protein
LVIKAFDIEASNLAADFGIVLCCGFKDVEKGTPKVFNILDYRSSTDTDLIRAEKRLLKDIAEELLKADVWLTHYGQRYDVPFINTRLLYHNMPILPANFNHIDTWRVSRNHLKLRNNRLVTISEHLKTLNEKDAIKPEQWIRALGGHRPSMNYIVNHCRKDVLVLEQAYLRLRPLVLDHPNRGVGAKGGCRYCDKGHLIKRGTARSRTRLYQRYQCKSCGAWDKSVKPIAVMTHDAKKGNVLQFIAPPAKRGVLKHAA